MAQKVILQKSSRAIYMSRTPNFYTGGWRCWKIRVEVTGYTEKMYLVKLLEPVRNNKVGDVISVKKKNVQLLEPLENIDVSPFWYNNL